MDLAKLFSGIDYSDIKWVQKERCGFCVKERLNQTYTQYLQRGNICNKCSSMILEKHMANLKLEQEKRLQDKKNRLEVLGEQLEHEVSEEERLEIVNEMQALHASIKYAEVIKS